MLQRAARFAVLAAALAVVGAALAASAPAPAQPAPSGPVTYSYTVRFACGEASEGFHATAINVHNPSSREHAAYAERVADTEADFTRGSIRAGRAIEVGCNELRRRLSEPAEPTSARFSSGLLTLYSNVELDVTAVYTTRPAGAETPAIEVAVVEPRTAEQPQPDPEG